MASAPKIPEWLLILALAIVFLLIIAVGAFIVMSRDLPPNAEPEAIRARFAEQIAFLEELAASHTAEEFDETEMDATKDPSALIEHIEKEKEWMGPVEEHADLFSDPVILGAYIITRYTNRRTTFISVKVFEDEPEPSIPLSRNTPGVNQPALSIWQARKKRWITYENLVLNAAGEKRGYQLILDLDLLKKEAAEKDKD